MDVKITHNKGGYFHSTSSEALQLIRFNNNIQWFA